MNRRRALVLILLAAVLVVGLPAAFIFRAVHQERLDRALIAAVKARHADEAIALLDAGADPNARDLPPDARPLWQRLRELFRHRQTNATPALHFAMILFEDVGLTGEEEKAVDPTATRLTRALLKAGADPNACDEYRRTALSLASALPDPALIVLMLRAGADPNIADIDGATPLMWTAGGKNPDVCHELLRGGADVHRKDKNDDTALHYAASSGSASNIALLLMHGADPRSKDNDGRTPLTWAETASSDDSSSRYTETLRLLREAVRRRNASENAAEERFPGVR